MQTQAGGLHLFCRVAARAGAGVWRNRGGVLMAVLVSVALGGYVAVTWTGTVPSIASASTSARADCADMAMAAVADKSPAAAQRAYQCLDTSFQQRVTEADFVSQMQAQNMPNVNKMARVGDYHSPTGATMVYYALDSGSQSVGYIVYLGQNGKVLRIE